MKKLIIKNLIFTFFTIIVLSTSVVANTYEQPLVIEGASSANPNELKLDGKNYALDSLHGIMTNDDFWKLLYLVSDYRKGEVSVLNQIIELIAKYNAPNAMLITNYVVNDPTIMLLAAFKVDHTTNKVIYTSIDGFTPPESASAVELGNELWKRTIETVPEDFYNNIDFLYLEMNKPTEKLLTICATNDVATKFGLYVDVTLLDVGKGDLLTEFMIYGTVYYYVLKNDQIEFINPNKENYSYQGHYYKDNSYINKFYKKFWKGRRQEIDKGQFNNYPKEFFNNKASRTVYDDMAVSFHYYLYNGYSGNTNSYKILKSNFFDDKPVFVALAKFFRAKNGIKVRVFESVEGILKGKK